MCRRLPILFATMLALPPLAAKPDFFVSTEEPIEVDAETLAAIDRDIGDADEGRTMWERFPATAERFGNAIQNHVEILKAFPYIDSPLAERGQVRQLLHTPIVISYRVHEAPNYIEIPHFWHTFRKPPKF